MNLTDNSSLRKDYLKLIKEKKYEKADQILQNLDSHTKHHDNGRNYKSRLVNKDNEVGFEN